MKRTNKIEICLQTQLISCKLIYLSLMFAKISFRSYFSVEIPLNIGLPRSTLYYVCAYKAFQHSFWSASLFHTTYLKGYKMGLQMLSSDSVV